MSHFPILVNVNKVNWCVLTSIILLRNRTLHSQSFPIPRTFFYQSESELHTATSITTGDSKQNRNSRMSTSTTSSKVRISVIQLTSTENKTQNLKNVTGLINEAAKQGSKVIFLPECFDYIALDKDSSATLSESLDGLSLTSLKEQAKVLNVWLSLGGFHERRASNRSDGFPWVSNAHVLVDNKGDIVSCYRKVHLFDASSKIVGPNWRALRESNLMKPGTEILAPESTPIGKLGLGICYDLRFPEFSNTLRQLGADVLTFPAAFTVPTGTAHWEPLLRARAIENQCYVIAAAQVGVHNPNRTSYGHSMVIDPWGRILAEAEPRQSLISVDIDLGLVEEVRSNMEVFSHRRPEVYAKHVAPTLRKRLTVPDAMADEETVPFGHVHVKRAVIFLESLHSRALVNKKCVLPGHVLVISKRVAFRLEDLTPDEVADLFQLVQVVEQLMEKVHHSQSSTVTAQDGEDAGQTVRHIHVHVIPRKPLDFPANDSIYEKLANHDKGEVKWRAEEDMNKEAQFLREFLQLNFREQLVELEQPSTSVTTS